MSPIALSSLDLAVAALLVVANAALSLWLTLGLHRQLVVAGARTVVQLILVGLVLKTLFALSSPIWTGAMVTVMILVAGYEVRARQERRLAGLWSYGLGTASILVAATMVTVLALAGLVQPEPWYAPRYAIPLLGMVLGNCMTGVSLGLDTLFSGAVRERAAIEARLALGADRRVAFETVVRRALRSGLIPVINAMSAAGLVALPGMMTGQILAGVDPLTAVKYQILIMFLIAGGTGIGVFIAVFAGARLLSDSRHRLRLDRLGPSRET